MAGETSVDASTSRFTDASIPRHAQPRVAEGKGPANAKAAPAQRPISSGISGLDAGADEKVRAYLQADDELPGKLVRIDGSALAPNEKKAEKRDAIISAAQLHREAVSATLDRTMDTPLGRAEYAKSRVNQLGQELDKARKTGVFTDDLAKKYDEAVRNNLARWREALRNVVLDPKVEPIDPLFRSCEVGLRGAEQLASGQLNPRQLDDATKLELGKISRQIDEAKGRLPDFKRNREGGKIWGDHIKYLEQKRSDLVAGKIAPGLHQTPLELAKAAKQELTAKSRELDAAKAALAVKSDREARSTLSDYVNVLEQEYREVVISNFVAALEADNYAADLKPPNKAVQHAASRNYDEALGLLRHVAPEFEPKR